jgi:hypothetical protein
MVSEQELALVEKNKKKKPKSKRKKKLYKTGIHISPKCKNPIKYRSGWEYIAAQAFDLDKNVVEYEYESFTIPYIANVRSGKLRTYLPDFLVTYNDGTKIIVEIKKTNALSHAIVIKKAEAAEKWAKKKGMLYQIWSKDVIDQMKKNPLIKLP